MLSSYARSLSHNVVKVETARKAIASCLVDLPEDPNCSSRIRSGNVTIAVNTLIIMRFDCVVVLLTVIVTHKAVADKDCSDPLGMESGKIKDSQITVTGMYSTAGGKYARLNKDEGSFGAWCVDQTRGTDILQYDESIKIDLLIVTKITKVATQGRDGPNSNGKEYVETYKISYCNDNGNWKFHGNKSSQVFPGNSDTTTVVSHELNPPIFARYIRIHPGYYKENLKCLRLELYGCQQSGTVPARPDNVAKLKKCNDLTRVHGSNITPTLSTTSPFLNTRRSERPHSGASCDQTNIIIGLICLCVILAVVILTLLLLQRRKSKRSKQNRSSLLELDSGERVIERDLTAITDEIADTNLPETEQNEDSYENPSPHVISDLSYTPVTARDGPTTNSSPIQSPRSLTQTEETGQNGDYETVPPNSISDPSYTQLTSHRDDDIVDPYQKLLESSSNPSQVT